MKQKIIVMICILVSLTGCTYFSSSQIDETRPYYGLGNCKSLQESPYVLAIFLDDDESCWKKDSLIQRTYNKIEEGLNYIEEEAAKYDIELLLENGCYKTDLSRDIIVKYKGIVGGKEEEWEKNRDILDQIASSLGFESKETMHQYLQEYSGKKQIAYIILLNKSGRSHCVVENQEEGESIEYCIVYKTYLSSEIESSAMTIAHEFLHLFGADDYYDPYGDNPKRAALAERIYPNDIMYITYSEEGQISVGAYTAYSVGWTDEMPEECDCEEWWE